ncbi:MAG: hypothetical protein WAK17_15100 [Candidatus Nitrosopolaris sp.]|jgi:hypothetical protein
MARKFDEQKGPDFEDIWNRSSFVTKSDKALKEYNVRNSDILRPIKWGREDGQELS